MCCFYWLINKETAWPDRAELRQMEKTELNSGRKKAESGRDTREGQRGDARKDVGSFLVGHNLVVGTDWWRWVESGCEGWSMGGWG